MSDDRYQSFEEFWPFYVREHAHATNRRLHFLGTTAALGALASGVITGRWRRALLAPLLGYGPAWIGHFFVEKNKPATFDYPLWSLRADFVMYGKILAGTMDEEVARCVAQAAVEDEGTGHAEPRPSSSTPAVNVRVKDGALN